MELERRKEKKHNMISFKKNKKKNEQVQKEASEVKLIKSCQSFHQSMCRTLEKCATSESLWSIDNTKDRHKYKYAWNDTFNKPLLPST